MRTPRGICLALGAALALAACNDSSSGPPSDDTPVTEFVTAKRAWLPGERDSTIAFIQRTRQLSLPYAGDLSDYAGQILDPDSAVEIVPNPALSASAHFRPSYDVRGVRVPGSGWSSAGLDIRIVDNSQSPTDSLNWLGWYWWNNADSTWKGFVFIATASTTVPATTVNTLAFDAASAKSGAGGGEARASDTTYWQGDGWVRRNTARVSSNFAFGGATTVTSGPFTGGTSQFAFMSGVLDSVRLDRQLGSGTPATQYASITFTFVGSLRLTCVFPTPCTSSAVAQLLAARGAARAGRRR